MKTNKPRPLSVFIFCLATIICFCQIGSAQSGRRRPNAKPVPQSKPVETPTPSPKKEETPVKPDQINDDEAEEPVRKIESLLILGEIRDHAAYSSSNYLSSTQKECLRLLKMQPHLKNLKAVRGGKSTLKQAQERAKNETDVFILWIGYEMVYNNRLDGQMDVKYADYTILTPGSGKKLFMGRVDPKKVAKTGGVLGIPPMTKAPEMEWEQMDEVSKEIIYRLIRWGWLKG